MAQGRSEPRASAGDDYRETDRDQLNARRFSLRALVWAVSFVASTLLLETGALENKAAQFAAALGPTIMGVAAVSAYMTLLREYDELQQRIHLEALALGFGAGALFMLGYRLFERTGAPKLDVSDPLLVMLAVWATGLYLGHRRYS